MARRQELLGFNRGDNRFTINRGETVSCLPEYNPSIDMPGEYVEKCIAILMGGEITSHTFSGYDVILSTGEKIEVKHAHYVIDQSRPGRKIGQWVFTRVNIDKDFNFLVCVCFPKRGFDWSNAKIYKIPKDIIFIKIIQVSN